MYYRQMHVKYWCFFVRYWLKAVWGWHAIAETCKSMIIYEIIVRWLVLVQNYQFREDDTIVSKYVAVF